MAVSATMTLYVSGELHTLRVDLMEHDTLA
jgi:hypothetical protein